MIAENFTAVVVARNEAHRLPLVLENLKSLRHVIVIDNFSTDGTRDIAESFGRSWIQIKNEGGFCETEDWMSSVQANVKTPYMLLCACAEYLPISLLEKYSQVAAEGIYDVVYTQRVSITSGLPIPIDLPPRWLSSKYKGEVRFFRIGSIDYKDNKVHSRGKILSADNKILYLGRDENLMFFQYRDYDSSETEEKHRIYNDIYAKQAHLTNTRKSVVHGFLYSVYVFLKVYFLYGGFRFGFLGFIHSYYRFHMELGLVFRAYEWRKSLLKSDIQLIHLNARKARLSSLKDC